MKKILLLCLFGSALNLNAQTVVFEENFGIITTNDTSVNNHLGYQNPAPIDFSGSATLRNTTISEGYVGASGEACVFLGASTPTKFLLIEGIDTSDYQDLTLTLGQWKSTNAGSNQMTIEVSEDGIIWTELTYTRPTGVDTSIWMLISPTGTIPATTNLRIRFTNPSDSNVGFRIDDLKLTGTSATASVNNQLNDKFKVYPNPITDGLVHITNQDNDELNVQIFDITGKMLKSTKAINTVSVDGLATGVYLLKIESNGQSITKKIVIK